MLEKYTFLVARSIRFATLPCYARLLRCSPSIEMEF
jgi:hypothetical protein